MQKQPVYRAEAQVKIIRQPESFTRFTPVVDDRLTTPEDVNTLISEYRSRLFIDRVAQRVRATNHDRFVEPYWKPGDGTDPPSIEALLFDNRNIAPERNSLIVSVLYDHPRPDVASEVANFFIDEFAAHEDEKQADAGNRAVRELRAQVETHRRRIENLEKDLVDFKERHGSISFDRKSDIDGQELLYLTNALNDDRRSLDIASNRVELLEKVLAGGRPVWEVPYIAENTRVNQLLLAVSARRADLARLSARYRPAHPRMIEAESALRGAETELAAVVEAEVNGVRNRHDQARADHDDSAAKLEAKKKSILDLQRLQAAYDSMVRDLDSNRQMHQYLFQRVQETEAQSNAGINVQVLFRANPPPRPYRPSVVLSAGVAIAGGFGVAFALVLVLLIVDQKVKSQRDVERELSLPVLAALERVPGRDRIAARAAARALRTPSACETLSALAAGLRLGPDTSDAKTLLVVSTLASEGKSYAAAALAASFHRLGERVVLVCADLRVAGGALPDGVRPLADLDPEATGGWDGFIARDEHTGVDLVHGGGRHENPYALFNSPGFARFIEYLKSGHDRVIIDTPPLATFGDALVLSPFAEAALFVLRFNKVPIRLARRALRSLADAGVCIAGVVVNGVRSIDMRIYFPGYHKKRGAYRAYLRAPARVDRSKETRV
jgi:uncharacterized protein involved in exopolysaccharide biosynthesis